MGVVVGVMVGMKLKELFEFFNFECWGFLILVCVILEFVRGCKDFVISFIVYYDVVLCFLIIFVEWLWKRICDFDWDYVEKVVGGDDDWCNIKLVVEKLKLV